MVAAESLYVERIAGARPVLVFLHHGLGCVSLWRDFPRRVSEAMGCAALVYDRCGHGRSGACGYERQPDYLHVEAARLRDFIQAQGLGDVVLIGHSDGGTIALLYAALEGVSQPRGIVAEASHLFVEDVTRAGVRAAVDGYRNGMREKLMRHHGGNTDRLFWDWAGGWLSPRFDGFDIRGELQGVRCPVLAVQGADDEYGTLKQVEALERAVSGPCERAMIPACGHEPHLQAQGATLDAVTRAVLGW